MKLDDRLDVFVMQGLRTIFVSKPRFVATRKICLVVNKDNNIVATILHNLSCTTLQGAGGQAKRPSSLAIYRVLGTNEEDDQLMSSQTP